MMIEGKSEHPEMRKVSRELPQEAEDETLGKPDLGRKIRSRSQLLERMTKKLSGSKFRSV